MNRSESKLNRIHLLEMLLYAPGPSGRENESIKGKTRLQKEMFLVQIHLKDQGISKPHSFRPYIHGPFSRELYNDLSWLEFEEVVEETPYHYDDGGVYYEFRLTSKGIQEVQALLLDSRLLAAYETIKGIKKDYNGMNLEYLVRMIHEKYPEYVQPHLY